jgi:hypothetical protein
MGLQVSPKAQLALMQAPKNKSKLLAQIKSCYLAISNPPSENGRGVVRGI